MASWVAPELGWVLGVRGVDGAMGVALGVPSTVTVVVGVLL